jgi:microtubule-associated protein-like 6
MGNRLSLRQDTLEEGGQQRQEEKEAVLTLQPPFLPFDNFTKENVESLWLSFTERAPSYALNKEELADVFGEIECAIVGHDRPPEVLRGVSDALHEHISGGSEFVDAMSILSAILVTSTLPFEEKASFLFDACDVDGDGILVFEEIALGLKSAESGLARLRGKLPAEEDDVYGLAMDCWQSMCPAGEMKVQGLDRQAFVRFITDPLGPAWPTLQQFALAEGAQESEPLGTKDASLLSDGPTRAAGGDEFLSVKPWKGAIVPPSRLSPSADGRRPSSRLNLEFVHGYRAIDCKNNLFYASRDCAEDGMVFHAAAVGIVMSPDREQRFFLDHGDDITCLAIRDDGSAVATGEVGKDPRVHVWHPRSMAPIVTLSGVHKRGILALTFTSSGGRLISVGMDDHHSVAVHDISAASLGKRGLIFSCKGNKGKTLDLCCSPFDSGAFVIAGVKHIDFWNFEKQADSVASAASKRGTFGSTAPATVICAGYTSQSIVACGMDTGMVGLFRGTSLETKTALQAHKGPVYVLKVTKQGIVTGGKDGKVILFSSELAGKVWEMDIRKAAVAPVNPSIRGLDVLKDGSRILLGTAGSEIYDLHWGKQSDPPNTSGAVPLLQAHCKGELWGLAISPCGKEAMTAGDDHSLRLWCLLNRSQKLLLDLRGAARACGYSPDGRQIAVGMGGQGKNDPMAGVVRVYARSVDENSGSVSLTALHELRDAKQWISQIKYSPDGRSLAVGSHDNRIYLYGVGLQPKLRARFSKHSSYITHLDWSKDGAHLQSCSGSYELLYCTSGSGKHITSATSMRDVIWDGWTCTLGWPVQGIWPSFADGTDINAASRNFKGDVIATADDSGKVKLFRYPSVRTNSEFLEFSGHSSHVTQCMWAPPRDEWLISTGGNDRCIFMWSYSREVPEKGRPRDGFQARAAQPSATVGADLIVGPTESLISGGDEFMAVKPWMGAIVAPSPPTADENELRRAIEASKDVRTRTSFQAKVNELRKVRDVVDRARRGESCAAPDKGRGLELDFVHGFRDNVRLTSSGCIVYHAAALGIKLESNGDRKQSFNASHSDDVQVLALHPDRQLVATGQVGRTPKIIVWDSGTMETKIVLEGFHKRGILGLAFSNDGHHLVSIGQDDSHTLAIYEWATGCLKASTKGDRGRPLDLQWKRQSDDTFCCVGVKSINFWTMQGRNLSSAKGLVSTAKGVTGKLQNFTAVKYNTAGDAVVGTGEGELYIFQGTRLDRIVKPSDKASSLLVLWRDDATERFISGHKDGHIYGYDDSLKVLWHLAVEDCMKGASHLAVKSLCAQANRLIVGTQGGELWDMSIDDCLQGGTGTCLIRGHPTKGELWGLATCPTRNEFCTAGDDGRLRIWGAQERKMLRMTSAGGIARAVVYSPCGKLLAIGFGGGTGSQQSKCSGQVKIFIDNPEMGAVDEALCFRPSKQRINDVKFSPNGRMLAVACQDSNVYMYEVTRGAKVGCAKTFAFSKHNSGVTHCDWSANSRYLRSTCAAYELLFCDATKGKQVTSATKLRDEKWESTTCVLGWSVQGIWPGRCLLPVYSGAEKSPL